MSANTQTKNASTEVPPEKTSAAATNAKKNATPIAPTESKVNNATPKEITNQMLQDKTVIPILDELRKAIDDLTKALEETENCKQITPPMEAVLKKGEDAVKAIKKANITETNASSHTQNIVKLTDKIRTKCKQSPKATVVQQPSIGLSTPPVNLEETPNSSLTKYNQPKIDPSTTDLKPLYEEWLKGDQLYSFGEFLERTYKNHPAVQAEYKEFEEAKKAKKTNKYTTTLSDYIMGKYDYPRHYSHGHGGKRSILYGKRSSKKTRKQKRKSKKTRKH